MYRVLHVMGCSDVGGISTVVLNYYSAINRERIHFDIALKTETAGRNAQALHDLGAEIFFLPLKSKGIKAFEISLEKILKENHYDAIHIHEGSTSFIASRVAKKMGIKKRVVHSHSAKKVSGVREYSRFLLSVFLNPIYATDLVACGELAGIRTYGKQNTKRKNYWVLPNAINTKRFVFDQTVRNEVREELSITNQFVIGMVGRIAFEKNYPYALRIMEKFHKKIPNSSLFIIGEGEKKKEVEFLIKKHKMQQYVKMLGKHSDVERYYQAFDALLLTSYNEGFPVAAVEAMASGLPVLLSKSITGELKFGTRVFYLPLDREDKWVDTLVMVSGEISDETRAVHQQEVYDNGLDIEKAAKLLEKIYDC